MDEAIGALSEGACGQPRQSVLFQSLTTISASLCWGVAGLTRRSSTFRKRSRVKPDFAEAYYNLGNALLLLAVLARP